MVRLTRQGGVWKNSEDETLKAAVMKFGLASWERVASFLPRKSAKQAKERWYEWLDPSVKKTEWSRQEEEKLMHMAKIMPTQWRTIARIVGRTAHQCLEKYQSLLDSAQGRDENESKKLRDLRPGEIDPHPGAKPARPDAIDMAEDELEMLSEARARLSNTKGKKAKRKGREKMLRMTRQLAALQKQRELRAAGIETKRRRRLKDGEMDLVREIPYQRRAPHGPFPVEEELKEGVKLRNHPKFLKTTRQDLDGRKKADEEELQRKKDAARLRLLQKINMPAAVQRAERLNQAAHVAKRIKFEMPAPSVSRAELRAVTQLGRRLTAQLGTGMTPVGVGTATPMVATPLPGRGKRSRRKRGRDGQPLAGRLDALSAPTRSTKFRVVLPDIPAEENPEDREAAGAVSDSAMRQAKSLVWEELGDPQAFKRAATRWANTPRVWEEVQADSVFLPRTKQFVQFSQLRSVQDRCAVRAQEWSILRKALKKQRSRNKKLQQKLVVTQSGYRNRQQQLAEEVTSLWGQLQQEQVTLAGFRLLHNQETQVAVPARLSQAKSVYERVRELEDEADMRYQQMQRQ